MGQINNYTIMLIITRCIFQPSKLCIQVGQMYTTGSLIRQLLVQNL